MRLARFLICSAAIAAMTMPAFAQGQGRGEGRQGRAGAGTLQQQQRMSPEQAKEVWTWQAKDVANELELSGKQTEQVVEIYLEAREAYGEALRKAMEEARQRRQEQRESGERGGGRGGFGFNTELLDEHSAALKIKLSEALQDDKKARKATQVLGTFSRQWDQLINALIELDVDEETARAASKPIREYVLAMEEIRNSGDRETMRENFMAARQALTTGLGEVLTDEQVAKFTQRRRAAGGDARGGRGGVGGEGRGGRGGAGGRGGDSAQSEPVTAEIGKPAPNFTLATTSGDEVSLADYKGHNVILQWINPDCPVCRRVTSEGIVSNMLKEINKIDKNAVFLTINSTHYMDPGITAAYLKKHNIDAPGLIDRDGKVGKLYDAKTTPHMFIIDATGVLRYSGAIDDDQSGRKENATNFVVQAMRQIVAGETVSPDSTRPYGCSVKYAK